MASIGIKKSEGKNHKNTAQVNWWSRPWFVSVLAAFFTCLCFGPVLNNGFINWDDNAYVFENQHLQRPLTESLPYFFGANYFIGNYIPLTMLVYALEYKQAGLDAQLYHAVNLLLHALNVILMFWFIYRLSRKKTFVAAFVALMFGVHPMHVESVAWVAELKDVLYSFFFLAALLTYLNYTEKEKKIGWFTLSFLLFSISVLCKPAAIVFPLVALLIDYYHERKADTRLWLEKIPFFIVSVVFGIVAIIAQQADELMRSQYAWWQKICFASHSFLNYLVKLFVPVNQAILHPYPVSGNEPLPDIYYLAPVVLALLLFVVYRSMKKTRLYAFGFLFFAANVLLVLQFVSVGDAIMAERYTYLSYTGIFYIIGMRVFDLYVKRSGPGRFLLPILAFAVLLFGFITRQRCGVWKNDDTIATDLLAKYPNDWLALNNKGYILFEQKKYEEAKTLLEKALDLKPDYTRASINLSNVYLNLNKPEMSVKVTEQALEKKPKDYNLIFNKAYFLYLLGRYIESVKWFDKAIETDRFGSGAYLYKSECYYYLKDYHSAIRTVDQGLSIEPGNHLLLNNKGFFLMQLKQYEEAVPYFNEALRIKPGFNTASANLNNCMQLLNSSLRPAAH